MGQGITNPWASLALDIIGGITLGVFAVIALFGFYLLLQALVRSWKNF